MKKVKELFTTYYLTFCVYALIGWLYEVLWLRFVVEPHAWVNRGVLLGPFLPIYGFGMLILLVILKEFMKKKHPLNNYLYLVISTVTTTTFIYTTVIEYTTSPKILSVGEYLSRFGFYLLITNLACIGIVYFTMYLTKKKKLENLDTTIILVFLEIWIITTLIEYVSHYVTATFFNMELWNYTKDFLNINARVNWDASRNFAIGGTLLLYTVQPILDKYLPKLKDKNKLILTLIIGIPMLLDFVLHVLLKVI